MRLALAWVVACAGCAQVFGIDNTSAPKAVQASVTIDRLSIGATLVTAPQDLSTSTASFVGVDGSEIAATLAPPSTWTASIPSSEEPAASYFTLPDYPMPVPRLYALPAADVTTLYGVLEHPDPEQMPPGAMLSFNVTLPSAYAGEGLQLYTLGSWTQYVFSGGELPVAGATTLATTVSSTSIASLSGRPLDAYRTDDAILVLRYAGNQLTGVLDAPPFAQTGDDTITGTMAAVTADQMLQVMLHPADPGPRFAGARPPLANLSMAWYVDAAPGSATGSTSGPQLAAAGVAATDTGAITATYGNPFDARMWAATLNWSTLESRSYTPTGSLPATLYAGLYTVAAPSAGLDVPLAAGLPVSISIDQVPLLADGATVTVDPTKQLAISFLPDQPNNTLYQLMLYELVPNAAATALQYQLALGVTGTTPSFEVPPDAFQAGHTYTLRAICVSGGYPALASGDLTMRSLPVSVGYLDSGVFTVAAP